MMKPNLSHLSHINSLKTFKLSYSPDYKNFILNHVATDPSHPLHETQKRRQAERPKRGLWWHATTSVDLNKSSCVRAWARRRLRNAIKEELKLRGYDENGCFTDVKRVKSDPGLLSVISRGGSLDLKGSLRLHVLPPLVGAKYETVRGEMGSVVEALVRATRGERGSVRKGSAKVEGGAGKQQFPVRPRMQQGKQKVK